MLPSTTTNSPEDVSTLRSQYGHVDAVRTYVKAYPRKSDPDLFWQSQLSKPALMFADVVESMIFDTKFDCNLKHAAKHYKSPTAILADYQAGRQLRQAPCCAGMIVPFTLLI